jgi:hypothetical protein
MTVDLRAEEFITNGHDAWNNDYGAESRIPKPSTVTVLADVIMEHAGRDNSPLSFGSVLDAVDLCAGRTAFQHVEGAVSCFTCMSFSFLHCGHIALTWAVCRL